MEEPEMNIDLVAEILRTLDELVQRVEAIEEAIKPIPVSTAIGGTGEFTLSWNGDSDLFSLK